MVTSLESLFAEYARRYSAQDAPGVTELCEAPFLAIREGTAIHLPDRDAVREHFTAMMSAYAGRGVAVWTPVEIEPHHLGDSASFATVRWNAKDERGTVLRDTRTTYHVLPRPGGLALPVVHRPLLIRAALRSDSGSLTWCGSAGVSGPFHARSRPTVERVTLTSSPPIAEAVTDFAGRVKAGSGLTTPGAVLVGSVLMGAGAMADLVFGDSLGAGFAAMFVIASAVMALTLQVRSLASAVIAPPLMFAFATMLVGRLSGEVHGSRALALDTATSLALSAPVLFGGTALAAAIAVVRLVTAAARRANVRR